jgi:hypothetical protein
MPRPHRHRDSRDGQGLRESASRSSSTGAFLLVSEAATRDKQRIAARGIPYPESGEPQREAQRESARALTGFALLALGVAVQVVGYAIDGGWGLLVIAVEVIAAALVLGLLVADGPVTSRLYDAAIKYKPKTPP